MTENSLFISNSDMKEFVKYLLSVLAVNTVACSALLYYTIHEYRKDPFPPAKEGCTAALFGNSVGETACNPAILTAIDNRSLGGTPLFWLQAGIEDYIRSNGQIKTLYISWEPLTYTMDSNERLATEKIPGMRACFPWICMDIGRLSPLPLTQWVRCLLGTNVITEKKQPWHFGFVSLERNNILTGQWSQEWYKETYPQRKELPLSVAEKTHSWNLGALRDIIDYCHRRGVKVVLIQMPMYHLDRWIDFQGFYDFLATLDDKVEIADYINFPMPDDSYYGDVQHLNRKGADYFCMFLKENGIRTIPLKEYIRELDRDKRQDSDIP